MKTKTHNLKEKSNRKRKKENKNQSILAWQIWFGPFGIQLQRLVGSTVQLPCLHSLCFFLFIFSLIFLFNSLLPNLSLPAPLAVAEYEFLGIYSKPFSSLLLSGSVPNSSLWEFRVIRNWTSVVSEWEVKWFSLNYSWRMLKGCWQKLLKPLSLSLCFFLSLLLSISIEFLRDSGS